MAHDQPARSAATGARNAQRTSRWLARPALAFVALLAAAGSARAQLPPQLLQDELDLQGRLNIVLGAGARAMGMGGAFLARADDATAASWNPAGLSYLLRPEVSLVGARNGFDIDEERERSRLRGNVVDFAAATVPIHSVSGAAQLSYQRMIPFSGSRTIVREQGEGVLQAQGGFDVLAFGTGWKVAPTLRIGATLNYWFDGFHQAVDKPITARKLTHQEVEFGFRGWNTNLGLIWSPVENLNIGAVAKTPFSARVDLRKRRTDYFLNPAGQIESITVNAYNSDQARVDFPAAFGVGASWRVRSSLTVSADYTHTSWSKASIRNFFSLESVQPGANPSAPTEYASLPYPLLASSQADTDQIRVGCEYVLLLRRFKWPLRAGYILDRQFFRAANGKAPRFGGVTVGTGVIVGPLLIDFAYLREVGRFTDEAGLANTQRTHRLFVSVIYRHEVLR